jgi:hypothetical protein
MEVVSVLEDVRSFETRRGNSRYVARDSDGNEYTTFREAIGERAKELKGQRVRITYHEEERGQYTNVYLDQLEPVPEPAVGSDPGGSGPGGSGQGGGAGGATDAEEAAWRTAVEAAPWLVGKPAKEVPPDELYEKLKPFEDRVAADIQASRDEEQDED